MPQLNIPGDILQQADNAVKRIATERLALLIRAYNALNDWYDKNNAPGYDGHIPQGVREYFEKAGVSMGKVRDSGGTIADLVVETVRLMNERLNDGADKNEALNIARDMPIAP